MCLVRGGGLQARVDQLESQLASVEAGLQQALGSLEQIQGRLEERRQPSNHNPEQILCWAQAGDLRASEKKVYSQNGEDGIIEEIFRRSGVQTRCFVEFGVEDGRECNCARLALDLGWRGLFMEVHKEMFSRLAERFRNCAGVRCCCTAVNSGNIEALLEVNDVPRNLDLLSIDIDSNDYWVWTAIEQWRPRVVIVEYNAFHGPRKKWVMKENLDYRWNGTTYYGASLGSLVALGRKKGYTLVGTDSQGVNAFFVLSELVDADKFLDPALQYHFSSPRYGQHNGGHPPGHGPHLEI